jgi:hypothetical protein
MFHINATEDSKDSAEKQQQVGLAYRWDHGSLLVGWGDYSKQKGIKRARCLRQIVYAVDKRRLWAMND